MPRFIATPRICQAIGLAAYLLLVGVTARAAELPLVAREDFESGASAWQPTDERSWKVIDSPQGRVYSLFQQSEYKPPFRSPVNIALLKDAVVGDFELSVKLQSTVKDYDHRSLVIVFGYQDPAHFYYVHFGKKTDDHANQIFIVDGAPRLKISTKTTPGTAWDDAWHEVKITRNVGDGRTAVYFDDLSTPVMTASDKTFTWGRIGIGAFDDLGNFDDVTLRGARVQAAK